MALLTTCALLFAALAAALAMATQAHAFSTIGALTLTPASGKIDDPLIASRVDTDGPCPPDTVGAPALMVVLPGQDGAGLKIANFTNDAATTTDGPLSGNLVKSPLGHRTLGQRLLQAIPEGSFDGVYTVGLTCASSSADSPAFTALIKVEGDSWSVLEQQTTGIALSGVPSSAVVGRPYKLKATVTPAEATGTVVFSSKASENDQPVEIGRADLVGGTATIDVPARATEGRAYYYASFIPADAQLYAASEADGGVPVYAPLTVTDAGGDSLDANPVLKPGDTVKVTARGFTAGAAVTVGLDGGSSLTGATADADGAVTTYAFSVPEDIEAGTHTLTLAEGADDGYSVAFGFSTDASATDDPTDPTDDPTDPTDSTDDPSDTASPDASDAGGSDDSGGSDSSAGSGDSGTGGLGADSGSGGGTLASTGAQFGTAALGGLALIAAGAALVLHVRRKGMLHFGTPRH
ncbi:hypothetical protein [Streptomyces sp. NBC_00102]|uniref:hypothetical protein n=1 Tax=Streptomyces sp. NBC_00102 TaxID=2975652 RepID=UPI002257E007|nr:hypothetical protein [Streptomyces sp. NBC_00102]MCX5400348.1 hypothetical protein [Streptomyces sp. NBC_00102]